MVRKPDRTSLPYLFHRAPPNPDKHLDRAPVGVRELSRNNLSELKVSSSYGSFLYLWVPAPAECAGHRESFIPWLENTMEFYSIHNLSYIISHV
jgi:hypothetical protein